ncbi:MAG TPA: hypothetical protein VNH65_14445 [Candidatus Acidoferrum sp.]|nr:hypothetical protein [Candidatus Acidoferrum sp.]
MRAVRFLSTGVLLLLLGAISPSYAQQEEAKPEKQQQDQEKNKQKDQNKQKAKGQQQQQKQQQQKRAQQQDRQQQDKGQQQQQPGVQQQQQQAQGRQQASQQRQRVQQGQRREAWQQHRATNWQSEHRDWQQRGGYNGYRIPDDRYRGNFGPNHWFRIHSYPMELYGGYPRFQYGGFWFGLIDPWPEYWSDDWYDNDDVYIDYSGDGYYLYNRRYPRDRVAISVYVQ